MSLQYKMARKLHLFIAKETNTKKKVPGIPKDNEKNIQ